MNKRILLEEIVNSITHGIGVLFSIVGLIAFLVLKSSASDIWKISGFCIFAGSLILMYLMSTLSHSLFFTKARKVFLILDHSAIFLLIAGTYTPFMLTVLKGPTGWTLLTLIWILSIAGIIFKAVFVERLQIVTVILYLVLGWFVILIFKPFVHAIKPSIFWLLLLGGICYSLGTIFYTSKRIPFAHAIWHLFVVAGTLFHFLAVYFI